MIFQVFKTVILDKTNKIQAKTACIGPTHGMTALIFAVKYIRNMDTRNPNRCQYAQRGRAPTNAKISIKTGKLKPNKWTNMMCFAQLTGLIKTAIPAK